MKLNSAILFGIFFTTLSSHAAQYALFNVAGGPGVDTLWANRDGSLMNGTGSVTMGYFPAGVTTANIDTIEELVANLGTFTSLQTATPGTSANFTAPGYLAEDNVVGAQITGANALIGRTLYCISSDAPNLAFAFYGSSYWFTLFQVAVITDDVPFENTYVANPAGVTPIIGSFGTFTGDLGLGAGTYTTLLLPVPEPSVAMLGAIGALGLLRRRRN